MSNYAEIAVGLVNDQIKATIQPIIVQPRSRFKVDMAWWLRCLFTSALMLGKKYKKIRKAMPNPVAMDSGILLPAFMAIIRIEKTTQSIMNTIIAFFMGNLLFTFFLFLVLTLTCPWKNLKRLLGGKNLKLQSQKLLRLLRLALVFHFLSDLISRFLSPAGLVCRRNPAAFTQTLPFKLSGNRNGFGDAKSLSVAPISKFLLLVKKEGEVRKPTTNWSKAFASTSPNLFSLSIFRFIFFPFAQSIAYFNDLSSIILKG